MAKDLFSIATQENKESASEATRRRKVIIVGASIFSILAIVYTFNSLKSFPIDVPVGKALDFQANQIILMKGVFGLLGGVTAFVCAGCY